MSVSSEKNHSTHDSVVSTAEQPIISNSVESAEDHI